MTALQVLKELKKEKWPELKTGEYNLPLILAAMHKFAELRQCNVSGQSEQFYCADWNRCGSICEEQCNACNKAENMPEVAQ